MKKIYFISGLTLSIITFLIFIIATINEDISVKLFTVIFFPVLVLGLSIPSSFVSKKLLAIGDGVEGRFKRVMFYVACSIGTLLAFGIVLGIGNLVVDSRVSTNNLATELSVAFIFLLIMAISFICLILPVIQTYIVIIIRKFVKEDK